MENSVFYLPTIYYYFDETNLVLLKRVCKEFYDIIQHMVDIYCIKASKITYGSMFSGTNKLAMYAYKYHINSDMKTFLKKDFAKKIIRYGSVDVLKKFIKKRLVPNLDVRSYNDSLYYVGAVHNGIDMLRFIYNNDNLPTNFAVRRDCDGDKIMCSEAAKLGKLECLQYLHLKGFEWNYVTSYNAAWFGHIDCLQYAIENGCEWNENVGVYDNGDNSECAKYYEEHILPNKPIFDD